jgi:hypothetical protein
MYPGPDAQMTAYTGNCHEKTLVNNCQVFKNSSELGHWVNISHIWTCLTVVTLDVKSRRGGVRGKE